MESSLSSILSLSQSLSLSSQTMQVVLSIDNGGGGDKHHDCGDNDHDNGDNDHDNGDYYDDFDNDDGDDDMEQNSLER